MKKIFGLASLVLLFDANAYVTLGTDGDCDFDLAENSLQSLIDDGEGDIRVTNQQVIQENLVISDMLILKGGFANCAAADNNTSSSNTVLDGNHTGPTVTIDLPESNIVTLIDFTIKNGSSSGAYRGGGVSAVSPNDVLVTINIEDSIILDNTGLYGGGMFINGVDTRVNLYNTQVINNYSTFNGGGVACSAGRVTVARDSGVSYNQVQNASSTAGKGGGIYATGGCEVHIYTGTLGGLFDYRGIASNSATGHGGGIYADHGSQVRLNSYSLNTPVNLNDNVADSDDNGNGNGGGVYLVGTDTSFQGVGAMIVDNTAHDGGGVAVVDDALFLLNQVEGNLCWDDNKCNAINGNHSSTNEGLGGAIFLDDGDASLSYTFIENNRADKGGAIYAENDGRYESSRTVFLGNGDEGSGDWSDETTFEFHDSSLIFFQSTASNNQASIVTIKSIGSYNYLANSIMNEPTTNHMGNIIGSDSNISCMIFDNNTGIQGMVNSLVATPGLASDGYHLTAVSPAIDFCSEPTNRGGGIINTDIDGEYDQWDDPNVINAMGIYDAGADESYVGDTIFKSAF